jgi:hypothetical protein
MSLFGKSLSEYVRFQRPILGLILIVALARLSLSLAGVSNSVVKYFSVTAACALGLVLCSILVHTRSFGSYKQLLVLIGLQSITAQVLSAAAIALAIVTGHDNIFSAPEYSGGGDGKTWGHAGAHLVLATTFLTVIGWAIGSLILYIAKKSDPRPQLTETPRARSKSAGK